MASEGTPSHHHEPRKILRPSSNTETNTASTMTSRYVRKTVPLETRAVQKAASQHQQQQNVPLPEAADEDLPHDYISSVNHAITSYNTQPTTPDGSGRSSPVILGEGRSTLAVSHGGWTTGNTTERSSVDSSCYSLDHQGSQVEAWLSRPDTYRSCDVYSSSISLTEFDRQAASTVNQHFEEFESMLFEGPKETVSSIYKECQEWVTQFPYLRVLGQQLLAPTDLGYSFVASPSSLSVERSSTLGTIDLSLPEHDLSGISDAQSLTLSGRKVKPTHAPLPLPGNNTAALPQADGRVDNLNQCSSDLSFLHEEVFAQDGIYEDIIAVDYKDIYEENMEHKKQITPRRRHVGYPPITPNANVKDSVLSGAFDQMWNEIMSWLRPLLRRYISELEGKKGAGALEEHILEPQRPVRASSFIHTPRDAQDGMLPLLQVSKMALRDRNSHSMSSVDMGESTGMVGGESSHAAFLLAQQVMANQRPATMQHQRRRLSHSQHLDPLPEPSKLHANEEGRTPQPSPQNARRAKRFVPPGPHRLSSPPTSVIPGRLPPLESSLAVPSHRKFGHRASSAVDNKEGRKSGGRERNNSSSEVSRPSTTQAFRSDPPFAAHNLRSSTPMVHSIPGRQVYVMGGNGGGLNVMGNGLYPSADHPPPPGGLEDQEGPPPVERHSQWRRNFSGKSQKTEKSLSSNICDFLLRQCIPSTPSFSFFKPRRTLRN